jgi:hypothetical protein
MYLVMDEKYEFGDVTEAIDYEKSLDLRLRNEASAEKIDKISYGINERWGPVDKTMVFV